jgi:hypothetical protein
MPSTITMNTILVMFALIAAFGVMMVAATILPIAQQAHAVAAKRVPHPCSEFQNCKDFGQSHRPVRAR